MRRNRRFPSFSSDDTSLSQSDERLIEAARKDFHERRQGLPTSSERSAENFEKKSTEEELGKNFFEKQTILNRARKRQKKIF